MPRAARTGSLLLVLLPALAWTASGDDPVARPNILLIVVDDLGYGELGCQGNRQVPTPHIDSLSAEGVRCTAGYVTASYCSPSRAGLLTGRYQTRFGHELNPVGRHNLDPRAGLPRGEPTLAERLKTAGYATSLIGKWHLGATEQQHPLARGFDEFYGFLHEGHFYVPPPYRGVASFLRRRQLPDGAADRWTEGDITWSTHTGGDEPPYDADNPILRGRRGVTETSYLTEALSREAVAFLERHKGEPFFLYLAFSAVHSPMQARNEDLAQLAHIEDLHRRVFAAMLANLDRGVGAVLDKLRRERLQERTLVFLISDNGGPTRELTSSNAPLRGGKGELYEGGIRVPFLVSWPGVLPAGRRYDPPVSSLDVAATACAAAGLPIEAESLDGVDLIPYLSGRRQVRPHEVLFWRMNRKRALRLGDWKIVGQTGGGNGRTTFELFHLIDDPSEQHDLSAAQPQRLSELIKQWEAKNAEMVPPAWRP